MEQKIREAMEKIRPFLQRDGGDIEFIEYTDDHIVKVRLQGHCAGCPGRKNDTWRSGRENTQRKLS